MIQEEWRLIISHYEQELNLVFRQLWVDLRYVITNQPDPGHIFLRLSNWWHSGWCLCCCDDPEGAVWNNKTTSQPVSHTAMLSLSLVSQLFVLFSFLWQVRGWWLSLLNRVAYWAQTVKKYIPQPPLYDIKDDMSWPVYYPLSISR